MCLLTNLRLPKMLSCIKPCTPCSDDVLRYVVYCMGGIYSCACETCGFSEVTIKLSLCSLPADGAAFFLCTESMSQLLICITGIDLYVVTGAAVCV